MPVDATPEKRIVLQTDMSEQTLAQVTDTYVSHFVTCPHAEQHRKTKG